MPLKSVGMAKTKRAKIYPGVTSHQICDVLRRWVGQRKIADIAALDDLRERDFSEPPKVLYMCHFADLCLPLCKLARNGVLGHRCTKKGLEELLGDPFPNPSNLGAFF